MGKSRAEIQKAYRQRLKEKNNAEYLQRERERMRRNYIPSSNLSENDRRIRNEKNRQKLRTFYERKRQERQANQVADIDSSGYESAQAGPSQERGRLPVRMNFQSNRRKGAIIRWKRELSTANARIKQLELEREELRKKYKSAQRQAQRQKAKTNKQSQGVEQREQNKSNNLTPGKSNKLTPRKETEQQMSEANLSDHQKKSIRKSLMLGNVLLSEIGATKAESSNSKRKIVHNVISGKITRKYRCSSQLSTRTGLCRHKLNKNCTKTLQAEKTIRNSTIKRNQQKVETFLKREDNSRTQPGKRDLKRVGKDQKIQTHVLTDYLSNLYKKFMSENPNIRMSFTSFTRSRPIYILTAAFSSRSSCLCTKHQNAVLTIKSLRKEGFNISLNPEKGMEQIPSAEEMRQNSGDQISLGQWTRVEVEERGKKKYVTKIVDTSLDVENFLKHVQKQMTEFQSHVERVHSQYDQIRKLKEQLPIHEMIVQLDFAENYSCRSMDEVQSAYFNQTTVTLHPVVVYRKTEAESLTHKSFIIVSDEMAHRASTVITFIADIIPKVKELDNQVKCIHYWSDSPTSQYRNKQIFDFIANHEAIHGIKARWNFFEAGHGKGPCDGLGGTCKRMADEAMRSGRAVIQDAKGFFDWAITSSMKNVTFRFVSSDTCVMNESILEKKELKPVKGTMKVHAVVGLGESRIKIREVSCYCDICLSGQTCDSWKTETTKTSKPRIKEAQTTVADISSSVNNNLNQVEGDGNIQKELECVQERREEFQVGQYLAAVYEGDWYVGKIEDLDAEEDEIEVNFMESKKQLFQWPIKEDLIWISVKAVLCIISTPEPTGKTNRMLKISEIDRTLIEELFTNYKQ